MKRDREMTGIKNKGGYNFEGCDFLEKGGIIIMKILRGNSKGGGETGGGN